MNYTNKLECGCIEGMLLYGWLWTYNKCCLRHAIYVHLCMRFVYMHGKSQAFIVFFWSLLLNLPAFMRMNHLNLDGLWSMRSSSINLEMLGNVFCNL